MPLPKLPSFLPVLYILQTYLHNHHRNHCSFHYSPLLSLSAAFYNSPSSSDIRPSRLPGLPGFPAPFILHPRFLLLLLLLLLLPMGSRRRETFVCPRNVLPRRRSITIRLLCVMFLLLSLPLSAAKSVDDFGGDIGPSTDQEEEEEEEVMAVVEGLLITHHPSTASAVNEPEGPSSQLLIVPGQSTANKPLPKPQSSSSAAAEPPPSDAAGGEGILSLPSVLQWGHQELFAPSQKALTIVNTLNDTELRVSQLYSSNPNFHVVGFREVRLPPAGMLAAHVIFLPTDMALVEGFLVVHTSIGAVSVLLQGVGVAPAYRLLDAITIQQPPLCPLDEPFQPAIALQVSKSGGMLSTLVDGEVARKEEWTVFTVYPVPVSMIGESKLTFLDTAVGQKQVHWLKVMNPSDRPVSIELFVNSVVEKVSEQPEVVQCDTNYLNFPTPRCNNDSKCPKSSSGAKDSVFIVSGDGTEKMILQPNSTDAIGPIIFYPQEHHAIWRSNLILLNNLTGIEWMTIEGRGIPTGLTFFDGNDAVCSLEVEVNCSLVSSFPKWTLKEQIDTLLDDNSAREVCYKRTSKEFVAQNSGNSPLQVESLMLSGFHGFRIDSFHGFYLAPGESAKLLVSYYPDIGKSSSHEGELQLVTASGLFSVTLRAHIPESMLYFCKRAQLLSTVKRVFLQVCLVALFVVLLVFGRMLKQEAVSSDVKEWPLAGKSPGTGNHHCQDDGKAHTQKKPSIYVSIDFDCSQNVEKQCNSFLCFTRALHTVHSAVAHMTNMNYLSNSQPKIKIRTVRDIVASMNRRNDKNDSMMLEKNGNASSTHAGKQTSPQSRTGTRSPSRPRISVPRKGKGKVSLLPLEKLEAMQPPPPPPATSSAPEKDKEKASKRKRRKNGAAGCIPVDIDNSSDGSCCHSPLSTPSSPLKQGAASCRPVSPLVKGANGSAGQVETEVVPDRGMSGGVNKDGPPRMEPACNEEEEVSGPGLLLASRQGRGTGNLERSLVIKTGRSTLAASSSSNSEPSLKTTEAPPNLPGREQKAKPSKSRGDAVGGSGAWAAKSSSNSKLKPNAEKRMMVGQSVTRSGDETRAMEGSSEWRLASSSSGPTNLVSISAVAPHARAPGTPLMRAVTSTTNARADSAAATMPPEIIEDGQQVHRWCRGGGERQAVDQQQQQKKKMMMMQSGGCASEHNNNNNNNGSSSSNKMVLYDIWGDHFGEIGRNLVPEEEEDPTTKMMMLPLSTPPLVFSRSQQHLQQQQEAPAFSVFSCSSSSTTFFYYHPFHVQHQHQQQQQQQQPAD